MSRETSNRNTEFALDIPVIDPAPKVGILALALEQKHQAALEDNSSIFHPRRMGGILEYTDELIDALKEATGKRRSKISPRLGANMLTEITLMAHGVMELESAEIQGIPLKDVKARKRKAKEILGSRIRHDTVVEAIQRGLVPVVQDEQPFAHMLSPIEEAVLHLTALGHPAEQIGNKYGITQNTVDRYFESLRGKFRAKNMPHVMLRSFETGIFRLGEEIPDPDKKYESLRIRLKDNTFVPSDIGIIHPNELEFLRLLGKHSKSSFTQEDIVSLGFYFEGKDSKNSAFGHMAMRTMSKLEAAVGEPVIERRRARNGSTRYKLFTFRIPAVIVDDDGAHIIQAFDQRAHQENTSERIRLKNKDKRRARSDQGKPRAARPKVIQHKTTAKKKKTPVVHPKKETKVEVSIKPEIQRPLQQPPRKLSRHLQDPERAIELVGIRPLSLLREDCKELAAHVEDKPELGRLMQAIQEQIELLEKACSNQ